MTGLLPEKAAILHEKEFSRRSFIKGGGALVVGFSLVGSALTGKAAAAPGLPGQRADEHGRRCGSSPIRSPYLTDWPPPETTPFETVRFATGTPSLVDASESSAGVWRERAEGPEPGRPSKPFSAYTTV